MYLGIDIGGTKTLVATLTNEGVVHEWKRFPTPKSYPVFLKELANCVASFSTKEYIAAGIGVPGRINRDRGVGLAFGNLPWKEVPIRNDVARLADCPAVIENDANLAGLSEAMLLTQYGCILYVTISTGIGTGVIVNQSIDPAFADSEGGHILLEHKGTMRTWESFASGRALVKRFGKRAEDIVDPKVWQIVARDIAIGLYDLIAAIEPDAIVLGGGVATHLDKFKPMLLKELEKYATPLTKIPPIYQAKRPEQAVLFGCYDLARSLYGKARS